MTFPAGKGFFMNVELDQQQRVNGWEEMLSLPVDWGGLDEFDDKGNLKAFNPVAYLWQMSRSNERDLVFSFDGLENDLEAVVAETLMGAELRRIEFEAEWDESGSLRWRAPGHGLDERGDVLQMAEVTIDRYRQMSQDESLSDEERNRLMVMTKRFSLEKQQTELIIEKLTESQGEGIVVSMLPDNEVVYPVTQINYLTTYQLEEDSEGIKIVANPLMNTYSNRLMAELLGGDDLSEEELILGVQRFDWASNPEEVFLYAESLVNSEERNLNQKGLMIDRTKNIDDCREVIGSGRSFLEVVMKREFERLVDGGGIDDIKRRLDTAFELVVKNIVGFLSGERFLKREELMRKTEWYESEGLRGFSRERFLRAIVQEDGLQILDQPLNVGGACGSLEFGGIPGLSGGKSEYVKNCPYCQASIEAEISAGYKCVCGEVYEGVC